MTEETVGDTPATETPIYDDLVRTIRGIAPQSANPGESDEALGAGQDARQSRSA